MYDTHKTKPLGKYTGMEAWGHTRVRPYDKTGHSATHHLTQNKRAGI